MKLEDVTEAVAKYHPGADLDIIWDAYIYSAKAHRHQSRRRCLHQKKQKRCRKKQKNVQQLQLQLNL